MIACPYHPLQNHFSLQWVSCLVGYLSEVDLLIEGVIIACIQVINTAMSDPLTLTTSALVTLAIQKFVESGAGELAKKFTTEAIAKIPELWQQIKNKLQGRSAKVDEALAKLESGDRSAIDTVTKNLDVVLDEDATFAVLLQKLAQEINAGQILQVGLDGITANRVVADIVQDAKGDRVEQIGARDVNAAGDAVFKVKQTID